MTPKTARLLYDAIRACILTVAFAAFGWGLLGGFDRAEGNGLPAGAVIQTGHVVQGGLVFDSFNKSAHLDTSQVSPR